MSLFTLSCTTCATRGVAQHGPDKDEILACFKYAPPAGYSYWGIAGPPLWSLGGARWFDYAKVNDLAAKAGLLGCTEVYGPQFPTDSIQKAEWAAEEIALMFELADRMGAPFVVFTGGKRNDDGGLAASIAGIKRLLPLIRNFRCRLALEPHYGSQFMTRSDFDTIFSQIDDEMVGITVDVGHFHAAGVDWEDLIRSHASKIWNVHLKDHVGRQSVPIGKGEIDLKRLLEVLHQIDYEGTLAVELEPVDTENLPQYIAEAHRYLSDLVSEVTGGPPREPPQTHDDWP